MIPQELLNFLYKNNVVIDLDGEDLLVDAPEDFLNEDLIELLTKHKTSIIQLLKKFNHSNDAVTKVVKHSYTAPYSNTTSLAQERMLFLEELAGNNSYYNIPFAYKVSGALNRQALKKAFSYLISTHEILRTTYKRDGADYVQLINSENKITFHENDISFIDDQSSALAEILEADANYQFQLDVEWPIRVNLIKLSGFESIISINIHHIAADGLSARRILGDISETYNWFLNNPETENFPNYNDEYQYSDYANWQRNWIGSPDYNVSRDYWINKLDKVPHLHSIPTDFIRPNEQSTAGDFYSHEISPALSHQLVIGASSAQTTPFIFFQTAFAAFLSRYSGETDVVFGIASANRYPDAFINSIGLFVNTLAMRYQLSDSPSFSTLLSQAININDSAAKHQSFPFDSLVDYIQPQRGLSYNPLIQIMLVMHDGAASKLQLQNVNVEPVTQKQKVSKFDFSLHITPKQNSFVLEWEYNTDLFKTQTIEMMSSHFNRLLEALVETPDASINKLPLINDNEIPKTINRHIFPQLTCVHHLIEKKVLEYPDAIAMIDGDTQFTYRELNESANSLAAQLLASNGNIKRVGVCLNKSAEMIIAFFAILKAGAVYVPLDPQYPKERLEFMIKDSSMDVLLTNDSSTIDLSVAVPVLHINDLINNTKHNFISVSFNPDSPAYIIYTSGSTGKPKGVLVSHKSLFYSLIANQSLMQISNTDTMPTIGSQAFGVSLLEILLPLISGGTVLVLQKSDIINIDLLTHLTDKVTVLHAVPSLMRIWLDLLIAKGGSHSYPNLRLLLVGGEAVPDRLLKDIKSWRSHVRLLELYGMTELAVVCSSYDTTNDAIINYCIGKPHPNTEFYVLNEDLQHQPVGIPGELHIGGLSLATEYIGQPGITHEKFIVNPFDTTQRLYKTGDRVKRLADGHYEFLGRVDFQVSVRGVRIECGEIEALTLQVDGVKQAVAHVFDTQTDNQVLTLYFTLFSEDLDQAVIADNIRAHLNYYLPDYMCPSIIQKIDAFPLNPNGKVDRKALPPPDLSQHQKTYVAPRTDIEKAICEMWQDLLGVEQVGISDNFFQLGGHSLSATRLVAKINQTFNINLPLKALFTAATLEHLVLEISALKNNVTSLKLQKISREKKLQPSFSQQRLWFLDQIEGGSAHYNLTGGLTLSGALNYKALNDAFDSIIERHESLRTCFLPGADGQPEQIIQAAIASPITIIDLSTLAEGTRELKKAEQILEEARYVFNLRSDVMIRAVLLKLAPDEHLLLATMHHIASDGWSMSILLNELCTLYSAYSQGNPDPLKPLSIQYADYAHWQRHWLQGEVLEQQLGYWTKQLSSLPLAHNLPLDHPRPIQQSFVGDIYNSKIDKATLSSLNKLCNEHSATLFMGLHAVFSVLLSRYSNETDIVVGSPIANREQAEIADLIGFFVNTLVLRSDLSANPNFIELLSQSKAMLLDAYAHQQVPFEQIVERLQPERNLSYSPLFQIMLVLQNNAISPLDIPGLTLSAAEQHAGVAKYDLTLYANEVAEGLQLNWEFNTDLFEADTIARMATHFELLLKSLVAQPQENVFKVDILTTQERHQLLVEWNNTQTDYPQEKCIHELFEIQTAVDPYRIAVVFEEQQLTYQQLNEKANQLAHYLVQEKHVKPDTLVGICVERSLEMVVGILAILKAGGAYVPLDPEYPQARLAYMLEDANLTTVLTQYHLRELTPVSGTQAVYLDNIELKQQLQNYPITNPGFTQQGLTSTHLAYVIYTSGSTGNPKGVMVEHKNVVNFLTTMNDKPGLTFNDNLLAVTSTSFDIHGLELFLPLMTGAKLIIASRSATSAPDALIALIVLHQISIMQATPATWKMLLDANWQPQSNIKILCGGEALSLHLAQSLLAQQGVSLWNMYGPTETTIWSTIEEITIDDHQVLMGQPIGNTQVYIARDDLTLAPIGVPGELLIGGEGVTRGYLNRRELTQEKFVPNPFYNDSNSASSKRLYKTGDLVRWLANGKLEFLGRLDHQVKIRGFRIELGEIENALIHQTHIKDAVVLAKNNQTGDKHLVAYVVAEQANVQEAHNEFINHLRQHLGKTLPDYMVPSIFVFLERFPLTPNGKIDRKALPEPDLSAQHLTYIAPRTEAEETMCEMWQDILGLERVGITDNFFQLGGHSLSAARLVARINQNFSINLPLKILFTTPTVEGLVAMISSVEINSARRRLEKLSRDQVLLASHAQQRYWLMDQVAGGSSLYNMSGAFTLSGQLDYDILNQVFTSILERHESLRTRFTSDSQGQLVQSIQPAVPFRLAVTNLTSLEDGSRQLQQAKLVTEEANRLFSLSHDLMLRAQLLKLADKEHMLLVTMHHIASDGWSLGILIHEVRELYSAYHQGLGNPLLPLKVQYADYAYWHRQELADHQDSELEYWLNEISDAPQSISLPVDYARYHLKTNSLGVAATLIEREQLERFKKIMTSHNGTLFSGLFAGLSVVLHRWCAQDDIVVGVVDAGRDHPDIESLIGCFINTLAIRSQVVANEYLSSFLARTCAHINDVMAHKSFPFDMLVNAINPERAVHTNPLFNVGLLLQNYSSASVQVADLEVTPCNIERSEALLDLRFVIEETPEGLSISCDYRKELFAADSISLLLDAYQIVIEQLANQVELTVADIEIPEPLLQQVQRSRQQQYNICVAGTFTLEPLADSFYFWREELGLDLTLEFTPFQQVFQQLLDAGSELRRNQNGFNLILLSLQDWIGIGDVTQQQANLKDFVQRFCSALDDAQAQSFVPYILMICPSMLEVCGNQVLLDAIKEQQQLLQEKVKQQSRVRLVLPETLERDFALGEYLDFHSYQVGHIPYSPAYYSAIMSKALRLFSAHQRKPYKVVVLDCDNTLWNGVCAETGAQGVQVSPSYQYLQNLALDLQAKGLLLCLCSANEADDVWAVFDQHQDMLITRKHIVSARINWEPKWQNIQSLADELNLGLDSFIFIDDDALQCAQMKEYCPQVLTLQLPIAPDDIPSFLNNVWALDVEQSSALSEDRTLLYAQNSQREQLLKANNNRLEFLDSLALTIDIEPLNQTDCARAAELLLRTNQFNFTGAVVDETELKRIAESKNTNNFAGITARVDDRFGSYGLVGLALCRADETNSLIYVVNMVLSCRAFGRGVEYAMLNKIARVARERKLENIQLPFTRTARNTPALQFLQQVHKTIAQHPDASTYSNDNTNLFTVEDILRLDYRALLKDEEVNSNSGSDTSPVIETLAKSPISIDPNQLLTPVQYATIATLSQNFTELDEKIQQSAQQRRIAKGPIRSAQFVAPRTETEKILYRIWQDILKINPIGITDNFFQLGGNSLLAARLVRKINIEVDENFKIGSIFQFPTIEGSAQIIEKNLSSQPIITGEEYDPSIDYSVPVNKLLYKNKALNVIAYHTGSMFLDIQSKSITFDLLQHAFSLLIQIHPILNSKQYINTEGNLVHTFSYTTEKFNLIYKDFTLSAAHNGGSNPWLDCDDYVTTIPGRFTFTEDDRLFKAYLFNCGEAAPKRLFIIWHHNILDGFSVETIVSDFDEIVSSLLENGIYNKKKHYTTITKWYEIISTHANNNMVDDLHYWKSQPWNQIKQLPQDKYQHDSIANTDWASETDLAGIQRLWNDDVVLESMQDTLAKARYANTLSAEKTRALYSSNIYQPGINAFDVILLAISRAFSSWTNTSTSLVEIINSGRGLIFPDFDNTKTVGDIAFNAPLLINSSPDKPVLSSLHKISEERQNLPKLALSYKWNKNILERPEYAAFPQSQILINYDTGNRYEAGNDLNLISKGLVTLGYTNSNYKDISPELIAKDRIYLFIDIKEEQLFCQIEIPGYDGGVIYKNPHYHPNRVFTLGRDVIIEIENILDELVKA